MVHDPGGVAGEGEVGGAVADVDPVGHAAGRVDSKHLAPAVVGDPQGVRTDPDVVGLACTQGDRADDRVAGRVDPVQVRPLGVEHPDRAEPGSHRVGLGGSPQRDARTHGPGRGVDAEHAGLVPARDPQRAGVQRERHHRPELACCRTDGVGLRARKARRTNGDGARARDSASGEDPVAPSAGSRQDEAESSPPRRGRHARCAACEDHAHRAVGASHRRRRGGSGDDADVGHGQPGAHGRVAGADGEDEQEGESEARHPLSTPPRGRSDP